MSNELIETIISDDEALRNRSIASLLKDKKSAELFNIAGELESFRKSSDNLYNKVRASLFLFVIYRYYLEKCNGVPQHGEIPFQGIEAAYARDFEKSLDVLLNSGLENSAVFSAIADSYYRLSFQYLLDQVKASISQCRENHHLFNIHGLNDYPFSVPTEMTTLDTETGLYPVGMDASPVRLDPSHSGWSDIFFLGMDFPEGARVVNLSVNLRVSGAGGPIAPPCECYCRYIAEPVLHLKSIDLNTSKKISTVKELFNFGSDYLSLLKAGVVSSGIVPPCFEKREILLQDILRKLLNRPGGIEIVTRVNGIPKGSRLAVSTTLLSTIIARLMRFSGQIKTMTGGLKDDERRVVASRAILGEWLGGSGGGWQDSGGLWPGIKVITGQLAEVGHPEFGISRGCLLPRHNVFTREVIPEAVEKKILDSMVLVHGGISQDVGPILEMVTEKYLLKHEKEWDARQRGIRLFDKIVDALKAGDMRELGRLTTEDWEDSIQRVIPWVNNAFTEEMIYKAKEEFGDDYWGFLMLGGMSGGGMAFIVNPQARDAFKKRIAEIMRELKTVYHASFPFIIDPVVYDFELNYEGNIAFLLKGVKAVIPDAQFFSNHTHSDATLDDVAEDEIKERFGFDARSHEHMRRLLKDGSIGLARNRLPEDTRIEDISYDDLTHFETEGTSHKEHLQTGIDALRGNEIAVVTFAGGMGSRWSGGAAVVKPINPFIKIDGRFRSFIECHLAKSRKTSALSGNLVTHVFTTSYLTNDAISAYVEHFNYFGYKGPILLSPAGSIGHRVYPMERDLRFYWEEQVRQKLDENAQKVLDDTHVTLIDWAKSRGEGEDYAENKPIMRFNPPGHWYEVPNLMKNGTLAKMLRNNPKLRYLFCHNIDTMGAHIDPALLGAHVAGGACITFEVTPRRIEDAGGGLAYTGGRIRLIEGLALPREEDEYRLSYYNTLTNWITIDSLLDFFGLDRDIILEGESSTERQSMIQEAIRRVEKRMPAYVTIKNVKHVWGSGQEDVYPVAQFERLWGDMTSLDDLMTDYAAVSRYRGSQLKEPSLLDMWVNDGSFEYFKSLCAF